MKRLIIPFVLLIAASIACTLPSMDDIAGDAAATVEQSAPTDDAAPADDPTPEEQAPPDEEPAAEPTTAAPQPTAEEQAATEAQPTTASDPTAESAAPANACSHPYFPVAEGATWVYESGITGEPPETYTVTHSDVSDSGFTFTQQFEGGQLSSEWNCTNGELVQLEYGQVNLSDTGFELTFETVEAEGVTFPAPEDFVPGVTWQTTYSGTVDTQGVTLDFDIVIDYTYAADEEVTVPAGTFMAARVDQVTSLTFSGTTQEVPATSWYAEGVGLVNNESQAFGFESYYNLESYTIP